MIKLHLFFVIISFITTELLPFFPNIESNGIIHSLVKNLQLTKNVIETTTNQDLDNDKVIGSPSLTQLNNDSNFVTLLIDDSLRELLAPLAPIEFKISIEKINKK
jgi:hypothetical protein